MPEEIIEKKETEEEKVEEPEFDARRFADAIQGLLDQGASHEQVLEMVEGWIENGELPPEAEEVAKKVLEADEREADRLFGLEEE